MLPVKINLYGGPSSGKSTLSAQIYARLKLMGKRVELVREYAKELVYEGKDMKKLTEAERLIILAEQFRRESLLDKNVDFLITDSPMLLTAYFHPYDYAKEIVLRNVKNKEIHIWVERPEHFEEVDRSHNKKESLEIDKKMKAFLKDCKIKLTEVSGSSEERIALVLNLVIPYFTSSKE